MKSVLLAISTMVILSQTQSLPAQTVVRPSTPDLVLQERGGKSQSLTNYRGKIVVLNFWAAWCEPCREEMPLLVRLQERYESRGVQVIAVSVDERDTQHARTFERPITVNFPIWIGGSIEDMQRLELGSVLPTTAIVNREGDIVSRILGPFDQPALEGPIQWLLGDRGVPEPPAVVRLGPAHSQTSPVQPRHEETAHDQMAEGHGNEKASFEGASTVPSCPLCPGSPAVASISEEIKDPWTFSIRGIPNLQHSSLRIGLLYQFTPRLSMGFGFYPKHSPSSSASSGQSGDTTDPHSHGDSSGSSSSKHTYFRPVVDVLAVQETSKSPAVIIGTSSDRINLPTGQSFFAIVSKNLEALTKLPIAPYVGVSYGTYDNKTRPIGGLNLGITKNVSSTVIFDGVHLQPYVNVFWRRNTFSFLLVNCRDPGVSYSISF